MINLHNIDCMEALKEMQDNKFDLAIVDPPYGIGEDASRSLGRARKTKKWQNPRPVIYSGIGWDKKPMEKDYFKELKRISKYYIIWGANHFIENIPNANSPSWVVWYKAGQTPNCDFSKCELAYTNHKKGVKYFNFDWLGFGAVNAKEKRIHPTQKPVKLYEWLLINYAKEGDKILDTHLGSGSIAIACHNLGFDLEGYELDKEYFEAAKKRLEQHQSQKRLF